MSSLDDQPGTEWGGTNPWAGLQRSFNDKEADTLYFLSDGLPTTKLSIPGEDASYSNEYKPAAPYYASLNNERQTKPLIINTTSVMLRSDWMKDLSDKTGGNYIRDNSSGKTNHGHGNNEGDCDPSNGAQT